MVSGGGEGFVIGGDRNTGFGISLHADASRLIQQGGGFWLAKTPTSGWEQSGHLLSGSNPRRGSPCPTDAALHPRETKARRLPKKYQFCMKLLARARREGRPQERDPGGRRKPREKAAQVQSSTPEAPKMPGWEQGRGPHKQANQAQRCPGNQTAPGVARFFCCCRGGGQSPRQKREPDMGTNKCW